MTRIRFEDLPSTNTPRNAENLNKLNNVVISSTEPTTGEEVWLEKGKNLFNINDLILGYVPSVTNGELVENASRATTEMIEINNSVSYAWKSSGSIIYIFYYGENKNFLGYNQLAANAGYILSSNTNWAQTKYIRIRIEDPSNITNAQLEYGSTATTYEPYIDKKIYTKNDNGVYEEFYDETSVKGDLLFAGKTNTNLTLLDNINNYKYLEIYYTNSGGIRWDSKKISVEPTTRTTLQLMNISNTSAKQITQFFFKDIELSGASLTVNQNRALFMESSSTDYSTLTGTSSSDNLIYITKIVGYK